MHSSQLCFALFLSFACFLGGSFQTSDKPLVNLTASVRSIALGSSFKLTCSLHDYALDTDRVAVYFYQEDTFFCHYAIYNTTTGMRQVTFYPSSNRIPSLGRHALSSSFPLYEITVTPTTVGTHAYSCVLNNFDEIRVKSPKVLVTTQAKVSSASSPSPSSTVAPSTLHPKGH